VYGNSKKTSKETATKGAEHNGRSADPRTH
jgi:hypothetical protein